MKQVIEDIKVLLKNDKRIMAAAGFVVVALLFWLLTGATSGNKRQRPIRMANSNAASEAGSAADEQYNDLIVSFGNQLEEGKKQRTELYNVLERTTQDFSEHKQRVTGIFETLVDRFEQLAREVDLLATAMKQANETPPLPPRNEEIGPDELEPFGEPDADTVAPPPPELPPRVSVIAPGDSVPVRLLTGVNAPTDGTPYPVVFELAGPIEGPDGSALDLGGARIIAAAQGSESDGRAIFRLTQISIRHPSGRRSTVEVDGWIVGEDGVRGMGGTLIDKLGRLIVTTAFVSGTAALGERLDDGNRVVVNGSGGGLSLDQDDLDAATASAVSDASNRLGQVLLNRYESLVPVVEILSGREVVAIFSKPVEIEIINDQQLLLASGGPEGPPPIQ